MPLFHFFESLVPHALGEWGADITAHHSVETQTHRTGPQHKQTELLNATVTFSSARLPSEFKDIKEFEGFDYVKAVIEAPSFPSIDRKNEHTLIFEAQINKLMNNIKTIEPKRHRNTETKEILLVKANDVLTYFFKEHNLGLCPLTYFYHATPLTSYSYLAEIAREVIKNQLGIDGSTIYDSQRVYFKIEEEDKKHCEKYLLFDYVLAMYAFAQVQREKKFTLPDNEACIVFNGDLTNMQDKKLEIMFFDYGIPLEDTKVPLSAHPSYPDKLKNTILLMDRKNRELLDKYESLKQQKIRPKAGFRTPSKHQQALIMQKYTKEIVKNPPQGIKELVENVQKLYIELTKTATKNKEQILNRINQKNRVNIQIKEFSEKSPHLRENFIALPGNTEGLWPNFAALPSGYCRDLNTVEDETFGESIKITRSVLEHKRAPIGEQHASLIIPLEKVTVEDIEKEEKIECVNLLLDTGQCPGYIIQAIIVVSKLLRNLGGLKYPGKVVRVHYDEFIDMLRPNREKRSRALGVEKDEKAFFRAAIELLNMFYFKRTYKPTYSTISKKPLNNWEEIRGLFRIDKRGENKDFPYYDIVFNQSLFKLLDPDSDSPLFLQSNTKAMLSIPEQSLDYVPAAQLSLETLARMNLYGKNRNTILFGKKGYESGISRKALIHRFGLLKGKNEDLSHVLKRLDRTLKIEQEMGVVKEVRLNGNEAKDKMDTQLFIEMHGDYGKLYNINQWQSEQERLRKQLEAPLNPEYLVRVKGNNTHKKK